ncbi:MAG TPA: YhjD/YihY/BrkB family envelope integrity protein [Syntrophorhabdaceae bacterium]|nr:YhjD/YihY/BrkB family envelope integrity protein [Syntrophorhabdaceae bacterium]
MINKIIEYFSASIWQVKLENLSFFKRFLIRYLRILTVAVRKFIQHDSARTATVLTYYSLLNVVPLFAVIFAMAKGFGLKKLVVKQIAEITQKANWQPGMTDQFINFADSVLNQAKGGVIAGVGVVLLLWTVISILGKIEDSFNNIWEIKKPRTLTRKFTDYLSILLIAPVLLAISSSVTVVAAGHIKSIAESIELLGTFSSVIFLLLKLMPYVIMWLLLTAVYLIMPAEKVPVRSGIIGAVFAGTLLQIVQWVYIRFQIGVATQSAIYGSFAALPLFLGWLQTSWMIILFGVEVASANEYRETYGFHPDYRRIGGASRKLLVLRIIHLLVKRFIAGEKPLTAREISRSLKIPVSFVNEILYRLSTKGLVVEIAKGIRKEASFQPGRNMKLITIKDVLDTYEKAGIDELPQRQGNEDSEKLAQYLEMISESMAKSDGNVKLEDV